MAKPWPWYWVEIERAFHKCRSLGHSNTCTGEFSLEKGKCFSMIINKNYSAHVTVAVSLNGHRPKYILSTEKCDRSPSEIGATENEDVIRLKPHNMGDQFLPRVGYVMRIETNDSTKPIPKKNFVMA